MSKLWLIPPLIVGVVVLMMAKNSKQAPVLSEQQEVYQGVRTLTVTSDAFTPIATGYGTVQAAQTWKAISQVSARIIKIHDKLSNGSFIIKGDVLVSLDPIDSELNLAQAQVKLTELTVSAKNTQASLKIELRNLVLAEKEFKRLKSLAKKGTISKSSADAAERTMLSSRSVVQSYKNSLALIPTQKKLQQSQVVQAQRDLDNTIIKAPFDMNISALQIEENQYVSKGQQLFEGNSIDSAEIITYVSLSALKNLFFQRNDISTNIESLASNLSSIAKFSPTVYLDMGNEQQASWEARFVRFSDEIDAQTRTMGIVVAVDHPLKKIIPGIRPPLSKGMFVEVAIAGQAQANMIAIPRSAIHKKSVYVMDKEDRLQLKAVKTLYEQDGKSVIKEGLEVGDRLVLSDLIPAVSGMLLKDLSVKQ